MAIDCNYPTQSYNPTAIKITCDDYLRIPLKDEVDEYIATLDAIEFPHAPLLQDVPKPTVAQRFFEESEKWERETAHISSVTDIVSHASYQNIIDLGWEVVPTLLVDLQKRHRFWFPALDAITGIRPFDKRDAGNSKAMSQAWIAWGKRKGFL